VTLRRLTPAELTVVEPLVVAYPFKTYRNYRVFPRKTQTAVMLREIAETLAHADGIVVHLASGARHALAVARRLTWDTTFFGVAMARIEYLVAADAHDAREVLATTLEELRAAGVVHVSARVDVADIATLSVLEEAGFRVMDALVTYITRPRKDPPHAVREVGTIREFRTDDGPQLVAIAEEAYRDFRGRFHLDPHIPNDRCDAFYREWATQSIAMTMADRILVSEGTGDQLLGFLAFRRREPVSEVSGIPVFGGGLGACRADAPGAYAGLIRAGTVWAHAHEGVAECQTQNYNFATVRIYEAVGAHYVHGFYTLHTWLGS
jgi:hypothetical protein